MFKEMTSFFCLLSYCTKLDIESSRVKFIIMDAWAKVYADRCEGTNLYDKLQHTVAKSIGLQSSERDFTFINKGLNLC